MKKLKDLTHTGVDFVRNIAGKGFFHLLSANVFIQIAGFASQLLVAWLLSLADIGTIKLLQSYVNIAVIVASFGLNSSVLKLCSEERPYPERKYIFTLAIRYSMMSAFATCCIFFLLGYNGLLSSDPAQIPYFLIYSIAIIAIAVNTIQNAYLQALKKIQLLSKIQAMTKVLSIVLIVMATYLFKLEGYFIALVVGSYLTYSVLFASIRSLDSQIPSVKISNMRTLHWFYAKYSLLSNLVYQIYLAIDIILINRLILDKPQIGYYSFAIILIVPFEVLRGTVQQIVTPYFSEKAHDHIEYMRVITKYNMILIIFAIVVVAIAIVITPPVIHIAFHGKYDSSIQFFRILLVAWIIRCSYSIKSYALWGLGKIDVDFLVVLMTIIPAIGIVFYSIKMIGIEGAAIGMVGSELVLLTINEYFFRKFVRNRAPGIV